MESIAFVDDEQGVLDGIRRSMRKFREEWDTDFYASGEELIEALESKSYNVIVSDMKMPGLNGAETLLAVKKNAPETIRFVLSGFAQQELIVESVGAAHQFLSKPIEPDELVTAIRSSLAMRSFLASPQMRELMASLHTLPTLPEIYNELMAEMASEDFSLPAIGEIVEKDVALSASLLRLVNSAFFALVRSVESPKDAVSILGVDTVKNLALSSSVFQSFEGSEEVQGRLRQLNTMGQQMGMLVDKFSAKRDLPGDRCKDHAQLAAMMSGLGELIYLQLIAEKSLEPDAETPSPEELAAYLLGIWAMPYPVLTAVRWYQKPSLAPETANYPLALVHAAWGMYMSAHATQNIDLECEWLDIEFLSETVGRDVLEEWQALAESLLLMES